MLQVQLLTNFRNKPQDVAHRALKTGPVLGNTTNTVPLGTTCCWEEVSFQVFYLNVNKITKTVTM